MNRIHFLPAFCVCLSLVNRSASANATPLVLLKASEPSAATSVWKNEGSLPNFLASGDPKRSLIRGVQAVSFDGLHDAYQCTNLPASLLGNAPRTIALWVFSSQATAPECSMVSWGMRGGPTGSMLAFGWGTDPGYGAAAHWSDDMGWNGVPLPGHWHYLVYTYDENTAKVYDDGILKNSLNTDLNTQPGTGILVGAEYSSSGKITFHNEFTGGDLGGRVSISSLEIDNYAQTPLEIQSTFQKYCGSYGAKTSDAEGYLGDGTTSFHVGKFNLTVLKATDTAGMLEDARTKYDFLPGDRIGERSGPGYYYLGDLSLKVKSGAQGWQSFSSASRLSPVTPLQLPGTLMADILNPAMGEGCPLTVIREWKRQNGRLTLCFILKNSTSHTVTLGAFGAAMVFNNLITGRTLNQTHDLCCFATPYPGGDSGYLQVTRLNGHGPALLVIPTGNTPFEAYRPLYKDPTPRGVTFEGFYEWMTCTKAYAETTWKSAPHWNLPTERKIKPGESVQYGFQFILSKSISAIEKTLIENNRPVTIGIPGYVLPTNEEGHLFIHCPSTIRTITVYPKDALRLSPSHRVLAKGWKGVKIQGLVRGRCRVSILYKNGQSQFVQYYITPPETTQVGRYGKFMSEHQWFIDPSDPFHRTDSFMPWNEDTHSMVLQHNNSWFVGLSDEIGAGPSVGMAMKNSGQLDLTQLHQLDRYASNCLWGHVQNKNYSVRAGLFYYDPKLLPNYKYTVQYGWDKARAETTWRTFNYPHVTCVYYELYRIARYHPEIKLLHPWSWYLNQAYHTMMAIPKFAPGYTTEGLMVGSVFPRLIADLKREGWMKDADNAVSYMHSREEVWSKLKYPFGSEMPWDSTGQEEIYTWCRYFNDNSKARTTINAILGYMPAIPNWAYNGAARRYFDGAVNGCKYTQIVQMTNHYGSAINSIPVMDDYRRHPNDTLLLRIGFAGLDQILCNIAQSGFASYGFVTDPAVLKFDPNTADYGIAFYGYARNAGAYVLDSPRFGWLNFGCNLKPVGDEVVIHPVDGFHKRVFFAPFHLWITLDSGEIDHATFNLKTHQVRLTFKPATNATKQSFFRIKVTGKGISHTKPWKTATRVAMVRGAFVVPLKQNDTTIELKQ